MACFCCWNKNFFFSLQAENDAWKKTGIFFLLFGYLFVYVVHILTIFVWLLLLLFPNYLSKIIDQDQEKQKKNSNCSAIKMTEVKEMLFEKKLQLINPVENQNISRYFSSSKIEFVVIFFFFFGKIKIKLNFNFFSIYKLWWCWCWWRRRW